MADEIGHAKVNPWLTALVVLVGLALLWHALRRKG